MVCELMIKTFYCEIKESNSCRNTAKGHDDFKAPVESSSGLSTVVLI